MFRQSSSRVAAALVGVGIAVLGAGTATPARAAGSTLSIHYQPILFPNAELLVDESGGAPYNTTITESADGSTITVRDTAGSEFSLASGSPCSQPASDTVVCPVLQGNGFKVGTVAFDGNDAGSVTVDTPDLGVSGSFGFGSVTFSIPHSAPFQSAFVVTNISFGAGNDTFFGGTGVIGEVSLGPGTDFAYLFNSPAKADHVICGIAHVEPPTDTVVVDSADIVDPNCKTVRQGP